MNKFDYSGMNYVKNPRTIRILRTMKVSIVLLFVNLFAIYASDAHSQNATVNLKIEHRAVQQVLNAIESQTDYLFIVDNEVNVNREVSIRVKNKSVASVLDKLFDVSDVKFTLEGKHIFLSKKRSEGMQVSTDHTITGVIVDQAGIPIIGANVILKGTSTGTITDLDGKFSLSVGENAVLSISYIGYNELIVPVQDKRIFNLVMKEDSQALDEVVVIGYGTQKKKDLTGSVANVSADDMTLQSNPNVGQALQGKIAGVDIVSQGGAPGSGSRIMVRGIGTLNNSSPLFIVDGIYMDDIDHINPNDIASVDVLKDASSSAIYGSRAANGVIIVTTKDGVNTEGKTIVDFSANLGVQTPSKYLDMLNAEQWAEVTTISRAAIGKEPLAMAQDLENKEDNDWQDIMLGSALTQNYNVSMKGGGNTYKYYTGLGYYNQDGTVKGTDYERYTLQFKSSYKKGWFSAGNNLVVTYSNNTPLPSDSRGGLLGVVLQSIPTLQQYDATNVGGYGGMYGEVTNLPNPLGMMDPNISDRKNENVKAYMNLFAQVEFMDGLKYKLNITPDYQQNRNMDYLALFDYGISKNDITQLTEKQYTKKNILIENLLTFDRTFGKHKVSALAGYTYQDNNYRILIAKGKGMSKGLEEIDAATEDRTNSGYSTESTMVSILGRAFYSYDNKYMITATLRRDASSRFAPENRYGNFPSISAGWNIAEESFMDKYGWLDQLKLRTGYGVLGNQEIGDYLYTSMITTGINYPDGQGGLLQGAFPKEFATPNIKWEETKMTNVGIDFAAFNSRLSLVMDYYVKNTQDILLTVPIPISTGGANDPLKNAGEIRNKGFEFNLGWRDQVNSDFSYSVNLIGSAISNEVTQLGTGTQAIWSGSAFNSTNTCKTIVGYPIGGYWLIPTDGYFQSEQEVKDYSLNGELIQPNAAPGDIRFKDVNGDGAINDNDRVYQGSSFAKFTSSLNFTANYKAFDALLGVQGVFGNKIYNATRQTLEGVNKGTNFLASTYDYWTPENTDAAHPRLTWDDPNRNTRGESDRYLENGDFVRVRNMQIGYTFDSEWMKQVIDHARVYINVENPFTITGYTGYSPDVNSSDSKSRGFDYFTYPTNRTYMIGVNVSF